MTIHLRLVTATNYNTFFTYTPQTHLHVMSQQQIYLHLYPVTPKQVILRDLKSSLLLGSLNKGFPYFPFNPSEFIPVTGFSK
jgi:hypothetical protein